jgi:hypothetical protein
LIFHEFLFARNERVSTMDLVDSQELDECVGASAAIFSRETRCFGRELKVFRTGFGEAEAARREFALLVCRTSRGQYRMTGVRGGGTYRVKILKRVGDN